jgi:hypothetical protein
VHPDKSMFALSRIVQKDLAFPSFPRSASNFLRNMRFGAAFPLTLLSALNCYLLDAP